MYSSTTPKVESGVQSSVKPFLVIPQIDEQANEQVSSSVSISNQSRSKSNLRRSRMSRRAKNLTHIESDFVGAPKQMMDCNQPEESNNTDLEQLNFELELNNDIEPRLSQLNSSTYSTSQE